MARKRKDTTSYVPLLLAGGAVAAVLIVRAIGEGLGHAIGDGVAQRSAG